MIRLLLAVAALGLLALALLTAWRWEPWRNFETANARRLRKQAAARRRYGR